MPKRTIIVAHVPVLHEGYMRLFNKFADADELYIVGPDIISEIDYLRKDIRAINPKQIQQILNKGLRNTKILDQKTLVELDNKETTIVMPDDDIAEHLATKLNHATIKLYPVFLRWDRRNTSKQDVVGADRSISKDAFHTEMMNKAHSESLKSSNIWRRVGAVIVQDDTAIFAGSNRQLPTDYSIWIDGDPRSTAKRGSDLELTTDMHAEARLIAHAAKQGVKLAGASIYVTTFPCPPCSKLIAEAGISKCYFASGYATLDGEDLLKAYDVELIQVKGVEPEDRPDEWVTYPEKKK